MLPIWLLALLILNLAALATLGVLAVRLLRGMAELRRRLAALDPPPDLPPALRREAREGTVLIALRILNPIELAIQRVRVAGIAGRLTPQGLRGIVGHEAVRQLKAELPAHGVVADVQLVSRG